MNWDKQLDFWYGILDWINRRNIYDNYSSKEAFRIAFHYSSGSIPVAQCSILIMQYIESEWCHKQLSVTKRGKTRGVLFRPHFTPL